MDKSTISSQITTGNEPPVPAIWFLQRKNEGPKFVPTGGLWPSSFHHSWSICLQNNPKRRKLPDARSRMCLGWVQNSQWNCTWACILILAVWTWAISCCCGRPLSLWTNYSISSILHPSCSAVLRRSGLHSLLTSGSGTQKTQTLYASKCHEPSIRVPQSHHH